LDEIVKASQDGILTDAFGTGTAALIAKIEAINNDDVEYTLPNAETRLVSNWLYKRLSDTQTSKIEDTNNWIYKIK